MNSVTDSPRLQFGIANMLALTTIVGLMTAFIYRFTYYPINLYVIGMFVSVFCGQLLLFRGKRPRIASALAGFVFTLMLAAYLIANYNLQFGWRYNWDSLGWDVWGATFYSFFGGVIGYILGLVINGVFLIARKMQSPSNETSPNKIE